VKSLSRVVRPARGAVRTRGVLVQYGEGPRGEPAGRQVRRHRACEVERPLNAPGAKKNTAMSSDFRIGDCSRSAHE